jgi:diketogulonate reductase-like aldo/keto reductase
MTSMPRLGLGTWQMGDVAARRADEIAALRTGLDLGLTLIDTAEMYGSGRAETLVGEAIAGRRDEVFLVTKVLPSNASKDGIAAACERSLKRLATDRVDLYLLHWPGRHPIAETVAAFERLVAQGKTLRWGVSNFDIDELDALVRVEGGDRVAANQVYYNLGHRAAEARVLPWCVQRGVTLQAYSPLDQGRLSDAKPLRQIASRHGVTPAAIALAWTMRDARVVPIVKSGHAERVREFAAARDVKLTSEDLRALDAEYPAPGRDAPLDTV